MLKLYSDTIKHQKISIETNIHDLDVPYHEHDYLELAYILEGEAKHIIDGTSMHVRKGDYFIVDYGTPHRYQLIDGKTFSLINCMFSPQLIDETLYNCRRFEDVATSYRINFNYRNLGGLPTKFLYHDADGYIQHLLLKMHKEYTEKDLGYQELLKSKIIELLIETMRKIKLPNPEDFDNNMVQHVMRYVQKHFPEKLSLAEIAGKYDYSLSYISRIFKEKAGMNFQEYVQSVRIQESYRLLINTTKKITDIAMSVGYSDIKFFNEIFKRQTGMTPRQYRQSYNAQNAEET